MPASSTFRCRFQEQFPPPACSPSKPFRLKDYSAFRDEDFIESTPIYLNFSKNYVLLLWGGADFAFFFFLLSSAFHLPETPLEQIICRVVLGTTRSVDSASPPWLPAGSRYPAFKIAYSSSCRYQMLDDLCLTHLRFLCPHRNLLAMEELPPAPIGAYKANFTDGEVFGRCQHNGTICKHFSPPPYPGRRKLAFLPRLWVGSFF